MLLRTAVCLLGVAGSATAFAGECGPNGSPDVLSVVSWAVEVAPDEYGMTTATVSVEVKNTTALPIRMTDGGVHFQDALGGYISNIGIERDLVIPIEGTVQWTAQYGGTGLDRVPDLRHDEVDVFACVRAVLFDDGTKQAF